jgi:hypothetical protein
LYRNNYTLLIRYEAAVWRGALGVLKSFTAPLLMIELADPPKYVSQAEFGGLVKDILTDGDVSDLAGDSALNKRLRTLGFVADDHVLRSLPFVKKVPALCLIQLNPEDSGFLGFDELPADADEVPPQPHTPDES